MGDFSPIAPCTLTTKYEQAKDDKPPLGGAETFERYTPASAMPTLIVVGALWGDEAKGKLVDVLAEAADYNIRYSGGNNAGHRVKAGGVTFKFHLIPSGILHPKCTAVLGGGMVVCPKALLEEMAELERLAGRLGRLLISGSAHVVMPYHRALDEAEERLRGETGIGTTRRGIGPAYQDKAARIGIRMWDFVDPARFGPRLSQALEFKNRILRAYGEDPLDYHAVLAEYSAYAERLRPFVADVEALMAREAANGKFLLFEGAQGSLLDLDAGTYPYVTSAHPTSAGACLGTGLAPSRVDNVLGVCAAYSTRVGAGPLPTEVCGPIADRIREQGQEYGTTTGRPRRCGWLDLVALKRSAVLNGFTSLAVTRLDVLEGFEKVALGVGYSVAGRSLDGYPADTALLDAAEPEYEWHPGWEGPSGECRTLAELPGAAQAYLKRIEAFTETPISVVSVGPDRSQTILVRPDLVWPNYQLE